MDVVRIMPEVHIDSIGGVETYIDDAVEIPGESHWVFPLRISSDSGKHLQFFNLLFRRVWSILMEDIQW